MRMMVYAENGRRGDAVGVRAYPDGRVEVELIDGRAGETVASATLGPDEPFATAAPARDDGVGEEGPLEGRFHVVGAWLESEPVPVAVVPGYHQVTRCASACLPEGTWAMPIEADHPEHAEAMATEAMRQVRARALAGHDQAAPADDEPTAARPGPCRRRTGQTSAGSSQRVGLMDRFVGSPQWQDTTIVDGAPAR
jgi:hypothetical protein